MNVAELAARVHRGRPSIGDELTDDWDRDLRGKSQVHNEFDEEVWD